LAKFEEFSFACCYLRIAPVGRPHSSWMATPKNDVSLHNLTYEDAIEMAPDKPLWGLLAASGATHWWCMPNNNDDDEWCCYY